MHSYKIKEIFKTIQGEGYWSGRPAVFIRTAGCNLWNGKEDDRAVAICKFCDTDFIGGTRMTHQEIAWAAANEWGDERDHRFAVITGGEPSLQVDYHFVMRLHRFEFKVAIETNGTRKVEGLIDWITVSPKAGTKIIQTEGNELKVVYPQSGLDFDSLSNGFDHHFIQPMDGPNLKENTDAAIRYCLENPKWRLSLQIHKFAGLR